MARKLRSQYPNVHLMRPRFTNWGGWSLSQLHLDAIGAALRLDPNWTHFVNLSGQCYPIKTLAEIRLRIAASDGRVFVEMRPFSSLPADDWHLRWHPMLELPHKALKLSGKRPAPGDFELSFKGSQWSILPREFCEWQQTAPIASRIKRYLRGLLLSDELIIQTLVRNGPWRDRLAAQYGREIVWPGPKVMTAADLPRLLASPALFARKFDFAQDDAVLHALSERLHFPDPEPRSGGAL
jgi:Core-2/I-Branching enzyme